MRGAIGKALFLRSWRTLGHEPAAAVAHYRAGGFRWVAPIALWKGGEDREERNRDPELWAAFANERIPAWPLWGLPAPSTWRLELDAFLDFAVEVGAVGVVVDPEVEFRGHVDEARAFAAALGAGCEARSLDLAITSYAIPPADMPLDAFASVADFGIAQTYDRDLDFSRRKFTRSLARWRALGFREVYPAAGMHAEPRHEAKTPEELRRHLALVPPSPGVIVWPEVEITPAAWRVLAAWNPRTTRTNGGGAIGVLAILVTLSLAALLGGGR